MYPDEREKNIYTSYYDNVKTDLYVYVATNYPFAVINDKRQSQDRYRWQEDLDNRVRI